MRRIIRLFALLTVAVLATTGCGVRIPSDPDGTLERVRTTEILRAGATPAGAALAVRDAMPVGPLVDLVERFGAAERVRVEWTVGGEEDLVALLESGELDLVTGGFSEQTPWVDRVSVTRGIRGVEGLGDAPVVLLLPLGENAMQAAVETFIDGEVAP